MLSAWAEHPGVFALLSVLAFAFLSIVIWWFFKTRAFKHEERMELLRRDKPVIFSFSEKLLRYVPWQFWASALILLLLIVLFLICSLFKLEGAPATVLEIIKFVTGATIGALFGKNSIDSRSPVAPKAVAAGFGDGT